MIWQSGIPGASWDATLFARNGHFLQSSHWAAFLTALDKPVFYAQSDTWQCLAVVERSRSATRLYCPYGPTADTKKGLQQALSALAHLAREHRAWFVRLEPVAPIAENQLHALGLKSALKDIQQHQTWVQDLTKSQDELLADMTATNRNLYRNYASKGLGIRASKNPADMQLFIKMMSQVAASNRIVQHSDHYYQTMADTLLPRGAGALYTTQHNGRPVASAFVFDSPIARYYAHAASYSEARKLHPSTPLVAKMMFDAKTNGQQIFDFMGVAPADAPSSHRWAGFTKFKQSFGGAYKEYLGTWELPIHPLYHAYRGIYKAHKLLN